MEGTRDVVEVGLAETKVGKVSHFYPKISVAVIILEGPLRKGDTVRITGRNSPNLRKSKINVTQKVESMEIEHQKIEEAKPGDLIGLEVTEKVCEDCEVFKL